MNEKYLTVNALSAKSGSQCRDVKKWMELHDIPHKEQGGQTLYEAAPALAAIDEHQRTKTKQAKRRPRTEPTEHGLTPLGELCFKYMRALSAFKKAFGQYVDLVELLPVNEESGLDLTPEQAKKLNTLIDKIDFAAAQHLQHIPKNL